MLAIGKLGCYNNYIIKPMGIVGDANEDFDKRQIWFESNG